MKFSYNILLGKKVTVVNAKNLNYKNLSGFILKEFKKGFELYDPKKKVKLKVYDCIVSDSEGNWIYSNSRSSRYLKKLKFLFTIY